MSFPVVSSSPRGPGSPCPNVTLALIPPVLCTPPPQLETDPELLIPKARGALARYGHQVVIGNDLHRRKFEVVLVTPASGEPVQENASLPDAPLDPALFRESWIRIDLVEAPQKEIEEDIVRELVQRHREWTGAHGSGEA